MRLDWAEADAEDLPYPDGAFVVTSCIGVMFAPDQEVAARELVRVCRPGGTIGLISWTTGGPSATSSGCSAPTGLRRHPAPDRRRCGGQGTSAGCSATPVTVRTVRHEFLPVDHFSGPDDYVAYYRDNFGPAMAAYAAVRDDPDQAAALDRDFRAYAERIQLPGRDGRPHYEYDYLLLVATRS